MSTTPLPWKIGFNDGSGAGEDDEGIWIVGPGNAVVVCGGKDDWDMKTGVLTPDDARLIERAVNNHDRLLKALIVLLKRHRQVVNSGDCGAWAVEDEEEVVEARKAIVEAKR